MIRSVLVCAALVMTGGRCGVAAEEPPPVPPDRIVGTVYDKPITAADIGLVKPIDVTVKFDARDPQWAQMGRVLTAFSAPILERFVAEHKLGATEEELQRFHDVTGKRLGSKMSDELATGFINGWKTERELQKVYGGRVIFQQFGPEALDARRRLFEEAEQKGLLKFDDAGVRHLFYYYSQMDHVGGAKQSDVFEKDPWFFADPE